MKKVIEIPDEIRWELEVHARKHKMNLKLFIKYLLEKAVGEA